MLRVTIEFVPYGDESKAHVLHTAAISNDGLGTPERGDYRYTLNSKQQRAWRKGRIKEFPRLRLGAWDLLYRVLDQALGVRNGAETNGHRKQVFDAYTGAVEEQS